MKRNYILTDEQALTAFEYRMLYREAQKRAADKRAAKQLFKSYRTLFDTVWHLNNSMRTAHVFVKQHFSLTF